MKNLIYITALLVSGYFYSQNITSKYTANNDVVNAVYYYENGQIQQQGSYKDGKLHGTWISYDMNGNKLTTGEYQNGIKTGKWLVWNENSLKQVEYSDSRIASVSVLIEKGMDGTDE